MKPNKAGLERYIRWVRETALPTWSDRGFDRDNGRFHERLDASGHPLPVPHRAMVQARQIYVFAHAGMLGWHQHGIELAARAMETMRREFCVADAGCVSAHFSINLSPVAPHSVVRDAYTHAFILFAAAYVYRATGDQTILAFADEVLGFVDQALTDDVHGGLLNHPDDCAGEKLQNPQMHFLEALLALAEAAPGRGYLERAGRWIDLLRHRMLRYDLGILPERFASNWDAHPDALVADMFEPGHHFEWIWLLRWYEDLAREDLSRCRDLLLRTATLPWTTQDGLIRDQLGSDGRVIKGTHRLWPHCEAVKAATAVPSGLADPVAAALAETAAAALLDDFVGRPFAGGWTDQIDAERAPIVDYVPASSLYHLFLAAAVADGALAKTAAHGVVTPA